MGRAGTPACVLEDNSVGLEGHQPATHSLVGGLAPPPPMPLCPPTPPLRTSRLSPPCWMALRTATNAPLNPPHSPPPHQSASHLCWRAWDCSTLAGCSSPAQGTGPWSLAATTAAGCGWTGS